MEAFPKLITAVIPGQEKRFYLVNQQLDFIPEVKEWVDQKVNARQAPGTIKNFCYRVRWFYQFLNQKKLGVLEVTASDLSDFVLWLSTPHRDGGFQPKPLQVSTINQILHAVASLYKFLVRRGRLTQSPVSYETITRYRSAGIDGDLLAHTRQQGTQTVQRMELKLKEPKSIPKTVESDDLVKFIHQIHAGDRPNSDPSGFRDRLFVLVLKESGLRCGELLGVRLEDLDFSVKGIKVSFRPDNANGVRAKAGYGRDRVVHISPELFGRIDTYITEVWINANHRSDYLWLVLKRNAVNRDGQSTFGTALTQAAVNEMFAYYSERSGVKIHPHMLRHTHATDLVRSYLQQGESVDWKFIADRLGHSSVVTTMKTYVHLTKEDHKRAYTRYYKQKEEADAERRQSKPTRAAVEPYPTKVARPPARRRKSAT